MLTKAQLEKIFHNFGATQFSIKLFRPGLHKIVQGLVERTITSAQIGGVRGGMKLIIKFS